MAIHTPAGPVRAHIQALRDTGMALRTIARHSGASVSTVSAIRRAIHHNVTAETAGAILAIATPVAEPPAGHVYATKPRRQAQALYRIGYNGPDLQRHTGVDHRTIHRILNGANPYVTTRHATAIDRAYRALAWIPGPSTDARQRAAIRGWASPLAWEPETIADPDAQPDTGGRHYGRVTPDDLFVELALGGDRAVAVQLRTVDRLHAYTVAAERGIPRDVAAKLLAPSERSYYRATRELVAA